MSCTSVLAQRDYLKQNWWPLPSPWRMRTKEKPTNGQLLLLPCPARLLTSTAECCYNLANTAGRKGFALCSAPALFGFCIMSNELSWAASRVEAGSSSVCWQVSSLRRVIIISIRNYPSLSSAAATAASWNEQNKTWNRWRALKPQLAKKKLWQRKPRNGIEYSSSKSTK